MKEKKVKFNTDVLSSLIRDLLDNCSIEKLRIVKSAESGELTVIIPETFFDWQIKNIIELLMRKFPFLGFSFEPDEGLVIYEGENRE